AGLTVALLIGLWVHDELSYNGYNTKRDRVAVVMQNNTFDGVVETWWSQAKDLAPALRTAYGNRFEHVVLSSFRQDNVLSKGDKVLNRQGQFAEPGMADILALQMIDGSWAALDNPNTILIAASTAQAFFGTTAVTGESLTLNQKTEMTIGGVYADFPANDSNAALAFLGTWDHYATDLPAWLGWGNSWFQVFVELRPGEDIAQVSTLIKDLKYDNVAEGEGKRFQPQLWLHPMSRWRLYSDFENGISVGGRITSVRSFGIIGLAVLLLACINFMNLSTARSERRALEVGIRKTMGSRRSQLTGQFFSESILLDWFGGVIALGLTSALLPIFNQVAEKSIQLPVFSPAFWLLGLGICFGTGLLAGSYPALYLSSFSPLQSMRGGNASGGKVSNRLRQGLVVLQFTISVVLLVSVIVVNQQIQFAKARPSGFEESGLVGLQLRGEQIDRQFAAFRADLLQTGQIAAVSKSSGPITYTPVTNSGFDWDGKPVDFQDEFTTVRVDHDFGKTIGWQLKAGRDFSREHPADTLAF
ncbi:MAG: ABC transporter permease, partial [Bacteroidota bacterium]